MLKIQCFANRPIEENTYVVSDETQEAIIVDCGALWPDDQKAIEDYITAHHLKVIHHLLTHGHFDHMFGAQWVAETFHTLPTLHPADTDMYLAAADMCSKFFHRPVAFPVPQVGTFVADGDTITFGTHRLRIIHTPGHTPGGCCLYCEEEAILISGDSIFCGSIGRTDMQGGNPRTLMQSLCDKVLTLPEYVRILPGHGPETTVGQEAATNPYLI